MRAAVKSANFVPTADGLLTKTDQLELCCTSTVNPIWVSTDCKGMLNGADGKPLYKMHHTAISSGNDSSTTTNYYDLKNRKIGTITSTSTVDGDTSDHDYHISRVALHHQIKGK
jgi:hypothetical protein